MNTSPQSSSSSKTGAYKALVKLTLQKPGQPNSTRDIKVGEVFDATDEELQTHVLGRDYRENTQP